MQKAHIRVQACYDASLLHQRVEDTVTVIEQGIELISGRISAPPREAVSFGHDGGDGLKVGSRRLSLQAQHILPAGFNAPPQPAHLIPALLYLLNEDIQVLPLLLPCLSQPAQEIDLVLHLSHSPLFSQTEAFSAVVYLQLPSPDESGAAQLGVPDPSIGLSK